mmetsp:Transcript_175931/g.564101  ORF Transcript_175931/g.564101 Transcript_175931/m.564101 type:complete len:84 (-) Transcript_175931:2147-2398(-)
MPWSQSRHILDCIRSQKAWKAGNLIMLAKKAVFGPSLPTWPIAVRSRLVRVKRILTAQLTAFVKAVLFHGVLQKRGSLLASTP